MRFLHTSDWQIGKRFGQFEPDEAALLAEARFEAVERLARLASERRAEFVLVAGDVFDAQGVADKTIHRLFQAMTGFDGHWIVIPGNHDAGLTESVWTRAKRLGAIPDQVLVCLQPEPLLLEAAGAAILPAPLLQRHTHADSTDWFAAAATPPGLARIGLAHGCVQGILADDIDSPNPIAADRAAQAGLDYLALGDWHGTKPIDERTWYSGTPEPDRFKANGSGQALLVELEGPSALPRVSPIETARYRWRAETLTLHVPSDVERALHRMSEFGPADVVQLEFAGQTDLAGHRRLRAAIEHARGRTRALLADLAALRLEPTADDLDVLRADGYLGAALAELRAALGAAEPELAREALVLLADFLGGEGAKPGFGGAR